MSFFLVSSFCSASHPGLFPSCCLPRSFLPGLLSASSFPLSQPDSLLPALLPTPLCWEPVAGLGAALWSLGQATSTLSSHGQPAKWRSWCSSILGALGPQSPRHPMLRGGRAGDARLGADAKPPWQSMISETECFSCTGTGGRCKQQKMVGGEARGDKYCG